MDRLVGGVGVEIDGVVLEDPVHQGGPEELLPPYRVQYDVCGPDSDPSLRPSLRQPFLPRAVPDPGVT